MYRRFLIDNDYLALITSEGLTQLTRGNNDRLGMAEESAEMAIVEYMTNNFEIEKALEIGKSIRSYNRQITYPVGSYFLNNGVIQKVIKKINGITRPFSDSYWEYDELLDISELQDYSQLASYQPGDDIRFGGKGYHCVISNGAEFYNIRIPGVIGWVKKTTTPWSKIPFSKWDVVSYGNNFYTLINLDGYDYLVDPYTSSNWGKIGVYDESLSNYELNEHEYVIFNSEVYYPVIPVNPDTLTDGVNVTTSDPRNLNIKKHMLQLALYELHKLISPNNISQVRLDDYNNSIQWLRDAAKLKLNPQIPRKIDAVTNKEVMNWEVATFQKEYNPYENPWQI